MFKRVIISLVCPLCISVFPILETVASAAISKPKCPAGYTYRCPIIGGTKCCGCWKTGSEICTPEVSELKNINGCVQGENCPVLTCSVYGTVDLGDGLCDLDTLPPDPDCGIQGVAFCGNSDPSDSSFKYQRREVILSTFLTRELEIVPENCEKEGTCQCVKEGTCKVEIELDLESDCPDCCIDPKTGKPTFCCSDPYKEFITFTASTFIGQIYVCPGGFSTEGGCCTSKERKLDDRGILRCVEEVKVEDPLNQKCSLRKADLANYDPFDPLNRHKQYTCTPFPDDTYPR